MRFVITYFIVLVLPFKLFAQPGTLDKSFGENGQVITRVSNASVIICKGLIQPDNKIVAIGQYESTLSPNNGFIAIRYMPDGSIDSSFGDSGKTIISDYETLYPLSACLQNNGKILIAGHGVVGLFPPVYTGVIVRLSTDGALDSSFATNGFIHTEDTTYNFITVQPDGRIIVLGGANTGFVSRLLEDGLTDYAFGTNGYVFNSDFDNLYTGKIQRDGKIVLGGGYRSALPEQFLLKRLQPDGNLDSTFGSSGTTITQVGSYDSYITDLAFQSDGKIVALGSTDNYTSSANTRYNIDGSLDQTFAQDGIAHNFFPGIYGSAKSLVIQKDNKILFRGGVYIEKGMYAVERLTANGLIDSSFGVNGGVTTDFADYSGSGIATIGLQTTGKIVAIGNSSNIGDYNVSLARYLNDDLTQRQKIIAKIRRWLQHHNGIVWDNVNGINSYVVQRSGDGVNWTTVDRQQTTANSQPLMANSYTYNDPSPLNGTNYYRLQTTSVSGAVNYSNVIAITNDDIKISPNPAKNSLHIEGLLSNQTIKLSIVDFAGNRKLQAVVNSTSYNLNIASLKPGNYLLKIEMNNDVITKQFVKE